MHTSASPYFLMEKLNITEFNVENLFRADLIRCGNDLNTVLDRTLLLKQAEKDQNMFKSLLWRILKIIWYQWGNKCIQSCPVALPSILSFSIYTLLGPQPTTCMQQLQLVKRVIGRLQ